MSGYSKSLNQTMAAADSYGEGSRRPIFGAAAMQQMGGGTPRIQSHGAFDAIETMFKSWVNGSPKGKHDLWRGWHSIDYNGNGRVSLAEIDKWVVGQFPLLNNKRALMRAYKASNEKDGYVHKLDFPVLLRNTVYFNKLWGVFDCIDTDDDRRLTFTEFLQGLSKLGMGGASQDARAIFDSLDRNRGGIVLFDEFCKWVASVQCPVDSSVYDAAATVHAANPWQQQAKSRPGALAGVGRTMTTPRGGGGMTTPRGGAGGGMGTPLLSLMGPPGATPGGGRRLSAGGHRTNGARAGAISLGVIRLDYDYPPAPGDIDHPGSFDYDVHYRVVPGLTFAMCQSGKMSPSVTRSFVEAIDFLEAKGVNGITGDCGFMMYFQQLARNETRKPVFMSALAQLPAVTCGYSRDEPIAVLTANGKTLEPMRALIRDECGLDPGEKRYVIVGCEDVPGFEAVANGDKVDVARVTPGIVAKCKQVLRKHPNVVAFCFECTELPPYSDAVRKATGLPVYDAITCCNFFMAGAKDNARFGVNDWQEQWDGQQDAYSFGANLSAEDRAILVNKPKKLGMLGK